MKYIEDGINAPSSEIYRKIIEAIHPNNGKRNIMDSLYIEIRGTPPPDICKFLIENRGIYTSIRNIRNKLSTIQLTKLNNLLKDFSKENNNQEDKDNG